MNPLQRAIVALIARYQRQGGGRERFRVECNFEPSCSEYTRQAVIAFGVIHGLGLGWRRIRRCRNRDRVAKIEDPLPGTEERACLKHSH